MNIIKCSTLTILVTHFCIMFTAPFGTSYFPAYTFSLAQDSESEIFLK